jgi:hypothetical protein
MPSLISPFAGRQQGRLRCAIQSWFKGRRPRRQVAAPPADETGKIDGIQVIGSQGFGKAGASAVIGLVLAAGLAGAATAQPERPRPPTQQLDGQAWRRIPVRPGGSASITPVPRRGGKQCIALTNVAGAQLFGDRAIELTMKGGKRWRMILAEECPGLSFYQGFYYQQKEAGQLCAGRDGVAARSGGECGIAAIVPVPPPKRRKRR